MVRTPPLAFIPPNPAVRTMSLILHPGSPLVIGHRGAAAVRPENTLPSFQHAIELGVDAVEFDVRLTGDGVVVVHHDPGTERTCGDALLIHRSSIGALRKLDAASTFTGPYTPTRRTPIPLLDEVLELTRPLPVLIECKTVECVPFVVDVLKSHRATGRAVIGSYLHSAMSLVRASSIASSASRREVLQLMVRSALRLAPRRLSCEILSLPEHGSGLTVPIARFARWGRQLGVPVHVWTVNTAADANRLWDAGVTGIISDDPATILAARSARLAR
jgi:glycerophosphoryl diester phosphodiesterase